MIEVRPSQKHETDNRAALFVDGVEYKQQNILISPAYFEQRKTYSAIVISNETSVSLHQHRISEVSQELRSIILYTSYNLIESEPAISTNLYISRNERGEFIIGFLINFDLENWRHLWSAREYADEFQRFCSQRESVVELADEADEDLWINVVSPVFNAAFFFPVLDPDGTIETEARKYFATLTHLHKLTVASLTSQLRQESVVMQFDFPEGVREACEQYLIFFVRFLKDLGVEATADLQHEAGQVLFTVTPADKKEALDKIYVALQTYLQLASSPLGGSPSPEDEMAIQSLLANIDHLKSQLRLSYMMVRAQETTIRAQEVTITNQQRILSGEVLLDSLKTNTAQPKPEDKEEVIDGVFALGQYQDKGVTINLGELYRRLKRLFKDENKQLQAGAETTLAESDEKRAE